MSHCMVSNVETLLNNEITWLKKVRDNVREMGETGVEEAVLEGHLGIAKELLAFLPSSKKYELGSDEKTGINLIKVLYNINSINFSFFFFFLQN